jgi:catechol 2,3-dioxygenase-like lactoylglutathione lyase family enzyme
MIGYVTLGTNDFERSLQFYDQLLEVMNIRRLWTSEDMAAWGNSPLETSLCIAKPVDGAPVTAGNSVVVALKTDCRRSVRLLHAHALHLGATDEGPPGPSGDDGFYCAHFRDLDGNRLNAYCTASASS